MAEEDPKDAPRRDFLGIAVGTSAAGFAIAMGYPVARYAEPRRRAARGPTTIGKLEEIPVGGEKTVIVDDRPVLVLRSEAGEVRAFSAICTHLRCVVGWSAERKQIECPCHRGVYTADGQNLSGPPPRPLEELTVTVNEGSIIVSMT
jgi:cytochrome b6-f complex iron-sulfur subunit